MRIVVAVIATGLLGAILYGYTLPSTWHVERSVKIDAKRDRVAPLVLTMEQWPKWAVPEHIEARASEKSLEWTGGGRMEVTEVIPNERIIYQLKYSDGDHPVRGQVSLTGEGDTTVTWSDDGELGHNPIARYFVGRIVRDVGADMEMGLVRLKQRVERN